MLRVLTILIVAILCLSAGGAESALIDDMDQVAFKAPEKGGKLEIVEGKVGKAIQFSFENDAVNMFFSRKLTPSPEWDKAAGFSFWVKGDGSKHFGSLELIWNGNFTLLYAFAFPINSKEWAQIFVPWHDLTPVKPKPGTLPIDPKSGNAPSKFTSLSFGKRYYWRQFPAESYTVDEIRLEPAIELNREDQTAAGAPMAAVLQKLKAGQPISIVTMGDSLTDYKHWSNRDTNWPMFLKKLIADKYKSDATIINPALSGNQLRHGDILIPLWVSNCPEPDLVAVFFGGNDWDDGMRGEMFCEAMKNTIDRIRRATHGKSAVLIMTTGPDLHHWDSMAELADACRQAARVKNAGIADIYDAFHAVGKTETDRALLMAAKDGEHLARPGQELTARTVLESIESAGK